MNKFECMCAHINCGNAVASDWKSVKYDYHTKSGLIALTITHQDGTEETKFFNSMACATRFVSYVFRRKNQVSA